MTVTLLAGVVVWRFMATDSRGELVTDADDVSGTWELIRLEDQRRDRTYYDAGVTVEPYAGTWRVRADGGCNAFRGYLEIAPTGRVSVDVLGLDGPQVMCHGGLEAVPNVDALAATATIRLTEDNTLSLIDDGDNVLGTYHLADAG